MRSAPRCQGASRPRSTRICTAAMVLVTACVSCQEDTAHPPTVPQSPNVTSAAPVAALKANPADVEPRPAEIVAEAGDAEPVATNPLGGCDICHVDVEDELAGTAHHAEGVGCVKCHGPSEGHINDENNEVPPDRQFAREDIDSFCGECHECSRPSAAELAAAPPKERRVCTECHGVHDLRLMGETESGPTEETTGGQAVAPVGRLARRAAYRR